MQSDKYNFLTVDRVENPKRAVNVRLHDFYEFEEMLPEKERKLQASRCMECGVPFCHWACPVDNIMPEWQAKIVEDDWQAAYDNLSSTNNFPEITGRVCPAPCESGCVAAINDPAVTIKQNELAVAERAFAAGYARPRPPRVRTGKTVAVVGSGPAGLACADLLNKAGHSVTLFEADEEVGGLLRYGIPDFKLDKSVIDRRVNILLEEGLTIKTGVEVGVDVEGGALQADFDAICIAIGARKPRDLPIEGRELDGIHFALDYLGQQNRVNARVEVPPGERISAEGKHVIVIGGGDTGSDCIGTANRQGAKSVTQLEILPQPPTIRPPSEPWPTWPKLYKISDSHQEGCERMFSVATQRFYGEQDRVKGLSGVQVAWEKDENGRYQMHEIPLSGFDLETELELLAMGFVHAMHDGLVEQLGVDLDGRGNIAIDEHYMTSVDGVFASGDARRGASLVVWAIRDGRDAAKGIDRYLRSLM
ncbi:MAG: glutamate synthase subunit beta [Chloroflexota bacterium]